jgi:hypothetical protein
VRHEGPLLQLVDQLYPRGASADVAAKVARGLGRVGLHALVTRGARIGITAGSRGMADLPLVLRAAAVAVRAAGGDPFVAPCMGSHGGATAAGQRAVLEDLGVTEETVGAEIVTSNSPEDARIPIARANDREAVAAAIQTSGVRNPADVRLVWVRDTARLERIAVSEALLEEVRAGEALRPAGPLFALPYDENDDLRSPFS